MMNVCFLLFVSTLLNLVSSFNPLQLKVHAGRHWNTLADIPLSKGNWLQIEVKGNQTWNDFVINTDADGFDNFARHLGAPLRYKKDQSVNMFSLICCMNNNLDSCQHIGKKNIFEVTEDGELSCFANDHWLFYFNNWGSVIADVFAIHDWNNFTCPNGQANC